MGLTRLDHVSLVVISKAFPRNARRSRDILRMYGLDDVFHSIIFCEDHRSKADIAKAINVDVMIDDKREVLDAFPSSIQTIWFEAGYDVNRLKTTLDAFLSASDGRPRAGGAPRP